MRSTCAVTNAVVKKNLKISATSFSKADLRVV